MRIGQAGGVSEHSLLHPESIVDSGVGFLVADCGIQHCRKKIAALIASEHHRSAVPWEYGPAYCPWIAASRIVGLTNSRLLLRNLVEADPDVESRHSGFPKKQIMMFLLQKAGKCSSADPLMFLHLTAWR